MTGPFLAGASSNVRTFWLIDVFHQPMSLARSPRSRVNPRLLLVKKRHTVTDMKSPVGDLRRVSSPARATSDKISSAKDSFHYAYVPQTISPLYPRLQIHNPAHGWRSGNAPVEVIGASCPLPGIGLGSPWHIDTVQLVVAFIGPPGASRPGELITRVEANRGVRRTLCSGGATGLRMSPRCMQSENHP